MKKIRTLAPIALIFLLWAVFFWRVLTPDTQNRLTFQFGDFTLQFLAYRQMAFRQLQQGIFPVFEECLYSGYPFQADPQAQVLYPPVLVFMLLGKLLGWVAYPLRALEWEVMLHALIAAFGTQLFLRKAYGVRRIAAVFGAVAYAFGGYLTGFAVLQTAILQTAAWLPFILWALHGLATGRNARAYAALLAGFVFFALTAGAPQTLLFFVYAGLVAYAVWARQARLPIQQILLRGALAGVLAVGLSAAQLLPLLNYTFQSTRTTLPFDEAANGLPLHHLALFFLTGPFLSTWQTLYVGVPTLLFAGLALCLARRKHTAWLWVGIAVGALVLSFGANAFGFDIAYNAAPGYKQFHSQERHAVLVSFALAVLGAFGLDVLLLPLRARAKRKLQRAGLRVLGWAAVAATGLLGIIVAPQFINPTPNVGALADRFSILTLGLLGTGALWVWRGRVGKRLLWSGVVLALLVFDLFSLNRTQATQKTADPFPTNVLLEPINKSAVARVHNHFGLPLNGACIAGLREVGGGSPIMLKRYQTFLARAPEDVMIQLLNVRHMVSWRGGTTFDNGRTLPGQRIAQSKYNGLDANTWTMDWQPSDAQEAWVVSDIILAKTDDEIYDAMGKETFKPFAQAIVNPNDLPQAITPSSGNAGVEGAATGYMKIAAHTEKPALLVISKAYYTNWVATVNGVPVNPIVVNGALIGVPIRAGNSTVELSYRPTDLYVGASISLLTLLGMLSLLLHKKTTATEKVAVV